MTSENLIQIEKPKFELNLEPLKKYEFLQIKSNTDATFVAERISELKKHIYATEEKRKDYTYPLDQLKKQMIADERKITDPLQLILKILNRKLIDWADSQEQIRKVEAEKRRQEELKALEAERNRQLELASKTDSEEAAKAVEQIETNVARLEQTPVTISNTVRTESGSWGIQTRWRARIVDTALIPREFLEPNMVEINKYATKHKEAAVIPGIEFYSEKGGMSR